MFTATSQETNKAIKEYQDLGRPKQLRNMIALSNINLIKWALNKLGYYKIYSRDEEELEQEAFILMLDAIDKYDIEKGKGFAGYYLMFIQNVMRETLEYSKDKSLNEYVPGSEESIELQELIEDENAQEVFTDVEDTSEQLQIKEEIKRSLGHDVVKIVFANYGIDEEEKSQRQIAKKYGLTAFKVNSIINKAKNDLQANSTLLKIWNDYNDVKLMRTGSVLLYTGSKTNKLTSVVESATMRRLELEDRMNKLKEERIQKEIEEINSKYERDKSGLKV